MLGDKNVQLWQFIALGSAPAQMWNIHRSGYGSACAAEVPSSLVSELKQQDSQFKLRLIRIGTDFLLKVDSESVSKRKLR